MDSGKFFISKEEFEKMIQAGIESRLSVKVPEAILITKVTVEGNPSGIVTTEKDIEKDGKPAETGKTTESDPTENTDDIIDNVVEALFKIKESPEKNELTDKEGTDSVVRPSLTSGGGNEASLDVIVTPGGGEVSEQVAETPKYSLDLERIPVSEEEKVEQKKGSEGKGESVKKVDSEKTESKEKDSLDHMFDGIENKDDESVDDEVRGDDDYQLDEESQIKASSNKRKISSAVNASITKRILRSNKRFRGEDKTEKVLETLVVVGIDDEPEDDLPNIIKDFQIKEEFFKENKLD